MSKYFEFTILWACHGLVRTFRTFCFFSITFNGGKTQEFIKIEENKDQNDKCSKSHHKHPKKSHHSLFWSVQSLFPSILCRMDVVIYVTWTQFCMWVWVCVLMLNPFSVCTFNLMKLCPIVLPMSMFNCWVQVLQDKSKCLGSIDCGATWSWLLKRKGTIWINSNPHNPIYF